jgi:cation:H+ antiporter
LATTVVAAIRKQSDIALGNVIGSNLFNLLFVLGGAAAIQPVKTTGVQRIDLAMMMGTMILVVPLLATGKKLNRWEGGVLVAGYLGYLWIMWP